MQQLSLVEPAVALARTRGHAAAERAVEKTERVVDPEWARKAVDAVRRFAAQQPALFTMEMCRGVIELQGDLPEPTDKRAWGAVTTMAKSAGYIARTKTYFPAVSSNGSDKPCYRKGPNA